MSQPDEEKARAFQQALEEAQDAMWAQDWERAAAAFTRAVELQPQHYLALTGLGYALLQLGRYEEAAQAYRQALKLRPDDPASWERLADILAAQEDPKAAAEAALKAAELFARAGQLEKAVFNWERVVEWVPGLLQAHHLLARAYARLRRPHEAIREYLYTAALLQRLQRVEEALRVLQEALQLAPQHPELRRALRALQRGQQIPLPRYVRRTPPSAPSSSAPEPLPQEEPPPQEQPLSPVDEAAKRALEALAELVFSQAEGQDVETDTPRRRLSRLTESLRGSLQELAQSRDMLLLSLSQVVEAQTNEDWETAAAELERVIHAGVEHPAVFYDLGWLYARLKRPKRALKHLRKAMLHPDFALATHLLMAQLLYQTGQLAAAAQESLNALRVLDLQHAQGDEDAMAALEAHYESAREALKRQGSQGWKRFVENVLALLNTPEWRAKVRALREQIRSTQEDGGPAIAPLVDVLLETETPTALEDLHQVRALMRQGALDAAIEAAHFALFKTPYFLPLHMLIGDILWEQGLLEQATEKFFTLARVYIVRGDPRQATNMLRRILQIHPMHTQAHQLLIQLLLSQGLYDQVIQAYLRLAEVHRQLANLEAAEQTLAQALQLAQRIGMSPEKRGDLLLAQAHLAMERLDWAQAARLYRELFHLFPQDLDILATWLDLLLRQGEEDQVLDQLEALVHRWGKDGEGRERLLALLQHLLEAHPNQPDLHFYLGVVQTLLNRKEEAIQALDRAGELYLERDHLLGARKAIQLILKLRPPNANQYRELLRQLETARGAQKPS